MFFYCFGFRRVKEDKFYVFFLIYFIISSLFNSRYKGNIFNELGVKVLFYKTNKNFDNCKYCNNYESDSKTFLQKENNTDIK